MTGLEIIKAPGTTAGEIADIIAEHCPPLTAEDCDKIACRDCWLAWLTENEADREQPEKRTTPYRPTDKANERRLQRAKEGLYQCPPMRELRSLLESWQRQNAAPYSALKVCLNAFLAAEKKAILSTRPLPPPRDREA